MSKPPQILFYFWLCFINLSICQLIANQTLKLDKNVSIDLNGGLNVSGLIVGHHENTNIVGIKNITGKDQYGKKMEQNIIGKIEDYDKKNGSLKENNFGNNTINNSKELNNGKYNQKINEIITKAEPQKKIDDNQNKVQQNHQKGNKSQSKNLQAGGVNNSNQTKNQNNKKDEKIEKPKQNKILLPTSLDNMKANSTFQNKQLTMNNTNKILSTIPSQINTKNVSIQSLQGYKVNQNQQKSTNLTNKQNPTPLIDRNCRSFSNGVCKQCSKFFYMGTQNKCTPVNSLCKNYSNNGECTQCFFGYMLQSGHCIINQGSIPCKNSTQKNCCYPGFYLNQASNTCKRLNPICKTSNLSTGTCLSCYVGYSLFEKQGLCRVSITDPNCKQFKTDQTCSKCSNRFFINNKGKCTAVDSLCKDYNQTDGSCTSCYYGYKVIENKCKIAQNVDTNCKKLLDNKCIECSNGFFIQNNKCIIANPLCKTFNTIGACTSCYLGYDLLSSNCTASNAVKDKNCKTFDSNKTNKCVKCYQGYILVNGTCSQQNPLCKTVDDNGNCLSCWQGYSLSGPNCTLGQHSIVSSSNGSDPYCTSFIKGNCTKCSIGYYISATSGICTQIDPLCKTSDSTNGNCLSCYDGYVLLEFKCLDISAIKQ